MTELRSYSEAKQDEWRKVKSNLEFVMLTLDKLREELINLRKRIGKFEEPEVNNDERNMDR